MGSGATGYRTSAAKLLLSDSNPSIIRGNASEIMSLVDAGATSRGVDSSEEATAALSSALALAAEYHCVVSVSGATDIITDGTNSEYVKNGHPMMPRVTGLGCTASVITGAFAAVNPDMFAASVHAMVVMGICGEIAAEKAEGPGTLQLHFYDALYNLDEEQIKGRLK